MGHTDHLAHALHGCFRYTVIQFSLVAHDRIYEDHRTVGSLLTTVGSHNLCLSLTGNETGGNGIKSETEFLPHGEYTFYIIRSVHDIELPIVEGI